LLYLTFLPCGLFDHSLLEIPSPFGFQKMPLWFFLYSVTPVFRHVLDF
jgi:hypothetical protein